MSVQKAREQLELVEDSCPVSDRQADWFGDKMNASYLGDQFFFFFLLMDDVLYQLIYGQVPI